MTSSKDTIEKARKIFAEHSGIPIDLPPLIPLKPGETQVRFLEKKKKDASDSSEQKQRHVGTLPKPTAQVP